MDKRAPDLANYAITESEWPQIMARLQKQNPELRWNHGEEGPLTAWSPWDRRQQSLKGKPVYIGMDRDRPNHVTWYGPRVGAWWPEERQRFLISVAKLRTVAFNAMEF